MNDEEKPKKRTITIEVEDQEKGFVVHVEPSYKHTATVLEDLAAALGSTIGHSVNKLEGINHVTQEIGGMAMRVAMQTYQSDHGRASMMFEILMELVSRLPAKALTLKDMPQELKDMFDKKCKACDKLDCPLSGKGLNESMETVPECLH